MKTVLVVDDSEVVRQQVGMALQHVGFRVLEAADGNEGLAVLDKADVSFVICDVKMPRMNGLQMIEQINREQKHTHISILMLTTEANRSVVDRAKLAGACGWIVKPFVSVRHSAFFRRRIRAPKVFFERRVHGNGCAAACEMGGALER